jgi:hypothetical protein
MQQNILSRKDAQIPEAFGCFTCFAACSFYLPDGRKKLR